MATHNADSEDELGDDPQSMVVNGKPKGNRDRPHFPPYLTDFREDVVIPLYAQDFYKSLGRCICYHDDKVCTASRVIYCKYIPWTNFPVRIGNEIGHFKFTTWTNPLASRSTSDVQKAINDQYHGKRAWFPFWIAVHKLHEFIIHGIHYDAPTIVQFTTDVRCHIKQYIKKKNAYETSNLLGEETEEHRKLFSDYYDQLIPTLEAKNMTNPGGHVPEVLWQLKDKKDQAVKLLLDERNLATELFAKAELMVNIVKLGPITPSKPNQPSKRKDSEPLIKKGNGGVFTTAGSKKTKQDTQGPAARQPSPEQETTVDEEAQKDLESAERVLYLRKNPMDIQNLINGTESSFQQLNALLDQMRELSVF
jgi:hypothetical protein